MRNNISIQIYQEDWIPGFAAFRHDGELKKSGKAHVVLNVWSLLALVQDKQISSKELPYVVTNCLMHEVIHVLEAWANVEFDEIKVEKLLQKYRQKYGTRKRNKRFKQLL